MLPRVPDPTVLREAEVRQGVPVGDPLVRKPVGHEDHPVHPRLPERLQGQVQEGFQVIVSDIGRGDGPDAGVRDLPEKGRTIEAIIEDDGTVRLREPIGPGKAHT